MKRCKHTKNRTRLKIHSIGQSVFDSRNLNIACIFKQQKYLLRFKSFSISYKLLSNISKHAPCCKISKLGKYNWSYINSLKNRCHFCWQFLSKPFINGELLQPGLCGQYRFICLPSCSDKSNTLRSKLIFHTTRMRRTLYVYFSLPSDNVGIGKRANN